MKILLIVVAIALVATLILMKKGKIQDADGNNIPDALEDAAKEAIDNVGVQETGDNRGKAVEVYQASTTPPVPPGSPWCAAFVVYRLRNAAHDLALEIPADWPRSAIVGEGNRGYYVHSRGVQSSSTGS